MTGSPKRHILPALAAAWGLWACQHPGYERDVIELEPGSSTLAELSAAKKQVPDLDNLLRVKLPPNPTRGEVIDYINVIYALSRYQQTYLVDDPQVGMLTKVGRKYLRELLASIPASGATAYGLEAVARLAEDEDKELIASQLRVQPGLATVLLRKRWCADFVDELVDAIEVAGRRYLASDALRCLAVLEREETYPTLIRYFVSGWNSHTTYKIIRDLPGIELDEAIPQAWEVSRGSKYTVGPLTRPALELGYLPALDYVMGGLEDNNGIPVTIFNARGLALQFTPALGSNAKLRKWYKKHRERLVFDPKSRKFVPGP